MKPFVAIMAWDGDNRTAKYLDFNTLAEAEAHVAAFIGRFPNAFATDTPAGGPRDWVVSGKTLSSQPLPPAPVRPDPPTLEDVYNALRDKLQGKSGDDAALTAIEAKFEAVKPAALKDLQ